MIFDFRGNPGIVIAVTLEKGDGVNLSVEIPSKHTRSSRVLCGTK